MQQAIQDIETTADGKPKRKLGPRRLKEKQSTNVAEDYMPDLLDIKDSDNEDDDFFSDGETDDDSSDDNIVIDAKEIIEILPSKTNPAAGSKRKTRSDLNKGKSTKRQRQSAPQRSHSTSTVNETSNTSPSTKNQSACQNPIYLFFEEVHSDVDGSKEEGVKYFKCWHGSQRVLKITKKMRGNLNGLVGHLRSHFIAYYQMYEVLNKRSEPPTEEEINIASGKVRLDPDVARSYLEQLESLSHNIKDMFAQQSSKEEPWDQDKFEDLLARWCAACNQPFTSVEDPEFRALLQYTRHPGRDDLKIPSAKSVRYRIMKMNDDIVVQTREHLVGMKSKFSLSLDAWTSSNGYAFLAIVIHYVDNYGKLVEQLIDFRELIGEHSGENMAEAVWDTLQKFGITDRVIAFVMDNVTNNDTMIESLAKKYSEANLQLSAKDARMCCMPHTIHLAAMKLLEAIGAVSKSTISADPYQDSATAPVEREHDNNAVLQEDGEDDEDDVTALKSSIGKLRKIVRHVRSSPQRRKTWLQEAKQPLPGSSHVATGTAEMALMLILDVKTRWSSTHQMLRRALQFHTAIDSYVAKDKELRKFELSESDWSSLKLVSEWLKAFRSATTEMSSTKRLMLSKTLAMFRGLQEKVRGIIAELLHGADPTLRRGLIDAHIKLSDYYYKFDESRYYTWAALLDPRISYEALVKDYRREPDLLDDIRTAKNNLATHFEENYASLESDNPTNENNTPPVIIDGSPQKINFLERYSSYSAAQTLPKDELDEYFRFTSHPSKMTVDPLEWWHARHDQFPNLYRLACDVLCIPGKFSSIIAWYILISFYLGSAVAVERVFSGGRDTISLRRSSLKADTIQALMVVKAQLKMARIAITEVLGDD
ncbi:hypothetical protein D9758_018663 [Tetrapyrgos nigripes]|uniref:HAT C-terminal dimerisation domain-containing protein n=1 Tax=Tetrapyrgos nigripes TaxID=182062 RepID=A0A8H5F0J2_9AGAR|nr:hypothetical protein D9758_018663 [Tetrapyrgos nigripes]